MNCNTGEITNDPQIIKAWQDEGVPVLHLPDTREMAEYAGQVVPEEQGPSVFRELGGEVVSVAAETEKRLRRQANNAKLRILTGVGR